MIVAFFTFFPHHDAKITSGSRPRNLGRIDDAFAAEAGPRQLRRDRIGAGDLDELLDLSDA